MSFGTPRNDSDKKKSVLNVRFNRPELLFAARSIAYNREKCYWAGLANV